MDQHGLRAVNHSQFLFAGLRLAVLGAVLLPLVPIWTGVYTILGFGWVIYASPKGRIRTGFTVFAGVLAAIYLFGWIGSLVSSPADHIINGFLYVFGLPVGTLPSGAALALEALLLGALTVKLWPKSTKYERAYIVATCSFAIWCIVSAIVAIVQNLAPRTDVVLIAGSVWINWGCLGLLSFAMVRSHEAAEAVIRTFVAAAAILAFGMALQLVMGDFSYVLVSIEPSDFFERVRGSYYYHAPPIQLLAMVLPLALTFLVAKGKVRALGVILILGVATVIFWNSTRGLSLALASGLGIFMVLIAIGQRRPFLAILPALMLAALLSQIFYVKPGTVSHDAFVSIEEGLAGSDAPPTTNVETFISSNDQRSGLAFAGLSAVAQHPITGSGPGNAKIQPREDAPLETSSHVLGIDVAVMLGVPGLIFFVLSLGLPASALAARVFSNRSDGYGVLRTAIAAAFFVFAISTLFHPQERSEIIAMMFMLSGLAVTVSGQRGTLVEPFILGAHKGTNFAWGSIVVVFGFAGCLFVTSPSYVFPAAEFVLRYRQELAERPTRIETNSPLLGGLVSTGLNFFGVHSNVRVLMDDPIELATRDSYILWSPSREKFYPRLRAAAGIAKQLRYGQWMGIDIPAEWWLLDNFQPNLQFLKAGPNFAVPVGVKGLETVPLRKGQTFVFPSNLFSRSGSVIDINLKGADGSTAVLTHSGQQRTIDFNAATSVDLRSGEAEVEVSGLSADGVLSVTQRPPLLPSVTSQLELRTWVDGIDQGPSKTRNLNDLADLGGVLWHSTSSTVIEITGPGTAIGAYRFRPSPSGEAQIPLPRSWTIEGKRSGGAWIMLDSRTLVSASYSDLSYFLDISGDFEFLRVSFPSDEREGASSTVGLGEIELFPLADGNPE